MPAAERRHAMAATANGDLMQTLRHRLTETKLLFAIHRSASAASGTYLAMPRRCRNLHARCTAVSQFAPSQYVVNYKAEQAIHRGFLRTI
jgi:hypothetical protein